MFRMAKLVELGVFIGPGLKTDFKQGVGQKIGPDRTGPVEDQPFA